MFKYQPETGVLPGLSFEAQTQAAVNQALDMGLESQNLVAVATEQAGGAAVSASNAQLSANLAAERATQAQISSLEAVSSSQTAINLAQGADIKSEQAVIAVNLANTLAESALATASLSLDLGTEAIRVANNANTLAESAQSLAIDVSSAAQTSLLTAANAKELAILATEQASVALTVAKGIENKADLALTTAFEAQNLALEAENTATSAMSLVESKQDLLTAGENIEIRDNIISAQVPINLPVGLMFFAYADSLEGYLICNGGAISRSTYANLFALLGTKFGAGDGTATFNLPDLRGRVLQGASGNKGAYLNAGLPNIIGGAAAQLVVKEWFGAGDALYYTNIISGYSGKTAGGEYNVGDLAFNASRSNSIYGASSTVQPPALALNCFIKY